MYEARIEDMASDFENRLAQSGLTLDEYLKYTGADKETFLAGFRPQAERQVKIRLALEAIAQMENITMTEEEMNEEFKNLAERYEMKEEQIRQIVPVEDLAQDLCVEKAIKLVREAADVVNGAEEEKPAEEAPKKKRTCTRKKAEKVEEPAAEEAVKAEDPAPAEEAPKKRAPRKKKSDDIDPSMD